MKKYKVAIAGYGIVGKKRHEFINKNPHLEVVAISDKNDAQLKDVKGNFNLFYDIEMMFKEEFEILFVCLINNVAAETTIGKVESLIREAESTRTEKQELIEQLASYYFSIVVMVAAVVWFFTSSLRFIKRNVIIFM